MAIPAQGLVCGSVSDIRSLVWLALDELGEMTAEGEWDLAGIMVKIAQTAAAVLYVERTDNAAALVAALSAAAQSHFDWLERSGIIEGTVRVESGFARRRGH